MPTILAQHPRGPGPVETSHLSVAGLVRPDTLYTLTAIMDPADQADSTLSMAWVVTFDDVVVVDEVKVCGAVDRSGASVPPSIAYSVGGTTPTTIQFTCTLPRQVNIGFTLDFDAVTRATANR